MELCHRGSVVAEVVDRCCYGREREPFERLGEHCVQKVDGTDADGDVRAVMVSDVLRNEYFDIFE